MLFISSRSYIIESIQFLVYLTILNGHINFHTRFDGDTGDLFNDFGRGL